MSKKKANLKRRDFLSKSVVGMASLGFMRSSAYSHSKFLKKESHGIAKKSIINRKLGRTGIEIPIVSMGVMNAFNPELVKRSYEMGVRHFDTAAYYQRGKNEEMVGKVIKSLNVRDKVVIATKVYIPYEKRGMPHTQAKEFFLKTTEESLKRLQTDYVDILYIHNVKDPRYLENPGILEALKILKGRKKVRFLGFSTHSNMSDCINKGSQSGFFDVILTTFNYAHNDNVQLITSIKNAVSKGIGIIAMKTQCTQYWYRQQYIPSAHEKFYKGKILHTAVLKWALNKPYITTAIPGYTTFEQLEDDLTVAYDLIYNEQERKFLNERNLKLSLAYCKQCSRCVSNCPENVDIPTLMRVHMYASCYTNFYHARNTLNDIVEKRSLKQCVSCQKCVARCENQINIGQRIEELKTIYC